MSILLKRLEDVVQKIDSWFNYYQKDKANFNKDEQIRQKALDMKAFRLNTVTSIGKILADQPDGDQSFQKLDDFKINLEQNRATIISFLKTMDLKANPIFMSPSQFDLIQGFLDDVYTFESIYYSASVETQNTFSNITKDYPNRVQKHVASFRAIIPKIGILIDSEPTIDEPITVTTEETKDDFVQEENQHDDHIEPSHTSNETEDNVVVPPVTTEPIVEEVLPTPEPVVVTSSPTLDVTSDSSDVNTLIEQYKVANSSFQAANNTFSNLRISSDEEFIVTEMGNYDTLYRFLTGFKNFKWLFDNSNQKHVDEFTSLTGNWVTSGQQLYDNIMGINSRIRLTEPNSNQLLDAKPVVNHNTVATVGEGEDLKLGAQYAKIDRFITNEDGRRYEKLTVDPDKLFVKGSDDKDESGIDPYDIIQGGLGDCYFMCSLSALTKMDGGIKKIKDMITYNSNGTFTVKLYRPIKEAHIDSFFDENSGTTIRQNTKKTVGLELVDVVVSADVWVDKLSDSGDKAVYANSQDKGELWPLILEKAYAQLMGGYDDINSGFSQEAFEVLTGVPRRSFDFSRDLDKAKNALIGAFENKQGVTLATPPNVIGTPERDENGIQLKGNAGEAIMRTYPEDGDERIVAGHAYALDSIDNGIIKLINPHGQNHIKNMPLDSVHKYFSRIVVDF